MRITIITSLILLLAYTTSQAQYKRPYRVAYNEAEKSYLVTNRGDGTISQLDSNYKLKTIITGLTDPRDLAVGTFGGNKGLLVLDDNKIVVYDMSTFSKLITFNVTGAKNLDDIEIDFNDPGLFYLSDIDGDAIIKGKVGPPPFYTPTYTTLVSSGIKRPKGLAYNHKGELLVVSDEAKGKVYSVNTTTGGLTTKMSTGLDSLNSIVQDGQGNYYMTNWSDSYIYRCDSNFSNLTKLTGYNKPAGMVVNTQSDLLIVLCYLCNKLDFHKLHYFEPSSGLSTCSNDSFDVSFSISAVGIGTYGSSNTFVIEVSDSAGKFDNPIEAGSLPAASNPTAMRGGLPKGKYTKNLKYRVKSTVPVAYSSEYTLTVSSVDAGAAVVPPGNICKGSSVSLGMDSIAGFQYVWSPSTQLDDSSKANPLYTSLDTGSFTYKLVLTDMIHGCVDSTEIVGGVTDDVKLNGLADTVFVCKGSSETIGLKTSSLVFAWSPSIGLDDTTLANPRFSDIINRKYYIDVRDTSIGCNGHDSIDVVVRDLPTVNLPFNYYKTCAGDTVQFTFQANPLSTIHWAPARYLNDSNASEPRFSSMDSGRYTYTVYEEDQHGCENSNELEVYTGAIPKVSLTSAYAGQFPFFELEGKVISQGTLSVYLQRASPVDTVWYFGDIDTLPTVITLDANIKLHDAEEAKIRITSDSGCVAETAWQAISYLGVNELTAGRIEVYPNPTSSQLNITSQGALLKEINLISLTGVKVQDVQLDNGTKQTSMDVSRVVPGVYILLIMDQNNQLYQTKLLIH